jgi:hypothetical protein
MVSVLNAQIISKPHIIIPDQDLDPMETKIKIRVTKGKMVMAIIAIIRTIIQILLLKYEIVPQLSSLMQ